MDSTRILGTQTHLYKCLVAQSSSLFAMAARLACAVALLFCAMNTDSLSQPNWVPVSGSISYTGGPVGINTTPLDLLHINGTSTGSAWPRPVIRLSLTNTGYIATSQIAISQNSLGGDFSHIATQGDLVIRAVNSNALPGETDMGTGAQDIILSTQTPDGALRFATWDATASNDLERMTILNTGNVGIGTTTPTHKLEIQDGDFSISDFSHRRGKIRLFQDLDGYQGHCIGTEAFYNTYGPEPGWNDDEEYSAVGHRFYNQNNRLIAQFGIGGWNIGATDQTTSQFFGRVRIGANQPSIAPYNGYQLAVDGTIVTKELYVETSAWADFVFADTYTLPSLEDVEKHIQAEKHLPGIPSTQEVLKSGINMGEMQAKLLQKVEELTLYVIEQQKKIKSLETKLETTK